MSVPIVIADEAALRSYLEKFAEDVAQRAADRAVAVAKVRRDPDEELLVKVAALEYSTHGDADDLKDWTDKIHRAVTDKRVPNRAAPREGIKDQRNGRKGRQKRLVRRGDLVAIWGEPTR